MIRLLAELKNGYLQSAGLRKVTNNINWLFLDKFLRLGVGLVVSAWIARYLGPQQYGLWNYAIAFASIFGAFAYLGLDGIVVRDIVRDPVSRDRILGSAFYLKLFAGIGTLVLTLLAVIFIKPGDRLMLCLVALTSLGFIFASVNVIDFYYQSQVKSKYTVYAQNAAFLIITLVKVGLLFGKAPLLAFAIAGMAEIVLGSIFLIATYAYNHMSIRAWRFDGNVARNLLKDSWPLTLASMAIMVCMRIDQVMIGNMLGAGEVGVYSAAVAISEVWYFVPVVIAASLFPAIIESKKESEALYYLRLQKLYDLMALMGICVAVAMTFLSPVLIKLLYGNVYARSAPVLAIHAWIGITVCISTIHGKWLLIEGLQMYSLVYAVIGAIVNVFLNLIFIKRFGVNGAAMATLFAQCAPWLAVFFFPKVRRNLVCMTKALAVIFRINDLTK